MKLSYNQIDMIFLVISRSGENQPQLDEQGNPTGKEVPAPRLLNGEESAQRRHFKKAVESVITEVVQARNDAAKELNEKKAEAIKKIQKENPGITPEELTVELNKDKELVALNTDVMPKLVAINNEPQEIELTDKTKAFARKYLEKWGEDVGFSVEQDEAVAELLEALA